MFHGSRGSYFITRYINAVVRCTSESAVEGCPLPASVHICTICLLNVMTLRSKSL